MPLSRRGVLATALGASSLLFTRQELAAQDRVDGDGPPNVIFILADDLGYGDLGSFGNVYQTPNIDRIGTQGIKMTQAYANSAICSPTRVGLMTGQYQNRFRVGLEEPLGPNGSEIGLDPATPTMPRYMQELGYRTALVGKWHMGEPPLFGPQRSGYDRFYGIHGGATDYFVPQEMPAMARHDGEQIMQSHRYLTDELGDRAITEIRQAHADDVPLFLSLHFTAPHWPWEGPEDRRIAESLTNLFTPDIGNIETFQAMMTALDDNVGHIMRVLAELDIADNTIVVFTSDNGGERYSNVWPLTGMKGELLEGGIRVPVLARWPARIPAGIVSDQTAMSMDWMPTFVAAAGAAPEMIEATDGINLLPMLQGGSTVSRKLFWQYKANDQAALRDGEWKYLRLAGSEYLFNLDYDEHERANFADREPERFARMKQEHAEWSATMLPYTDDVGSFSNTGTFPDRY